jgi:hypothetical protein
LGLGIGSPVPAPVVSWHNDGNRSLDLGSLVSLALGLLAYLFPLSLGLIIGRWSWVYHIYILEASRTYLIGSVVLSWCSSWDFIIISGSRIIVSSKLLGLGRAVTSCDRLTGTRLSGRGRRLTSILLWLSSWSFLMSILSASSSKRTARPEGDPATNFGKFHVAAPSARAHVRKRKDRAQPKAVRRRDPLSNNGRFQIDRPLERHCF